MRCKSGAGRQVHLGKSEAAGVSLLSTHDLTLEAMKRADKMNFNPPTNQY